MSESNRYAKYKPDNAATNARDICPGDALTLNDVPRIEASGNYRGVIDSYLGTSSGLRDRYERSYQIESIPEADELVRACDFALKNESHASATEKAIKRVRAEAAEIARGLRAAVDELETTRDYPNARRNAKRKRRRLRSDGGQITFGQVHVTQSNVGKCDHVMKMDNGRRILCGNSAKWRVDYSDGDYRRFCGGHESEIEVLL